jgi:hypothetical protein
LDLLLMAIVVYSRSVPSTLHPQCITVAFGAGPFGAATAALALRPMAAARTMVDVRTVEYFIGFNPMMETACAAHTRLSGF